MSICRKVLGVIACLEEEEVASTLSLNFYNKNYDFTWLYFS